MDQYKIVNFVSLNKQNSFPWFEHLNENQCGIILQNIVKKIGRDGSISAKQITKYLDEIANNIPDLNVEDENCDLKNLFYALEIKPSSTVYINWYQYDDVDKIKFDDFIKYFDDIWYSSADDIDVFDETISWILSISHYGTIKVIKFK